MFILRFYVLIFINRSLNSHRKKNRTIACLIKLFLNSNDCFQSFSNMRPEHSTSLYRGKLQKQQSRKFQTLMSNNPSVEQNDDDSGKLYDLSKTGKYYVKLSRTLLKRTIRSYIFYTHFLSLTDPNITISSRTICLSDRLRNSK